MESKFFLDSWILDVSDIAYPQHDRLTCVWDSRISNNNIIQDSKDSVLYETLNSVILSEAKYLRI